jgi:hypothetical protein
LTDLLLRRRTISRPRGDVLASTAEMAWMGALRKVPWKTIIRHAPTIVDAARSFYGTTRSPAAEPESRERSAGGIDALRRAVATLEEREAQQAALFADLAKQVEEMATALEVLRARLVLASWGAALAVLIAVVAAFALLWRR